MAHRKQTAPHRLFYACFLALSACSPEQILINIPFGSTDRSAVVVMERGEETLVRAVDLAQRDAEPVLAEVDEFTGTPAIHLTAFLFEKTLSAIGLTAGEIAAVPEEVRSVELKGQREIMELSVTDTGAGDWRSTTQPSGAASMVRVPIQKPCVQLQFARHDLEGEQYVAGVIALTSTSALIVVYSDAEDRKAIFYELGLNRNRKLDIQLPDFSPRHLARLKSGRIYLTGGNPLTLESIVYYSDDLARGFTRLQPLGSQFPNAWIWGIQEPLDPTDPASFYAITEVGQLLRYEDDQWNILGSLPPTLPAPEATILVNGRDDLFALSPDGRAIFRYADGRVTEEETPVSPDLRTGTDRLTALERAPNYGVFLGSASGYFMERTVDGWHQVNDKPLIAENAIRSFSELQNGALLIGGAYGSVQQYYRTWGVCDASGDVYFISNTASVNRMLPIGDAIFVAGVENRTQNTRIIYTGVLREIP